MSSVNSLMNTGNSSTASALLASNPFASLADDADGGAGSPTLIHRAGAATAAPPKPSISKYPGDGLTRRFTVDDTIDENTRAKAHLVVSHPTAAGKTTFAFNIDRSSNGPFLNVLSSSGTYRAIGAVDDLVSRGEAKVYVDPFKEGTIWLYDLSIQGYEITFFDFRWSFLNFYKKSKDAAIVEWAKHMITAIKNKTPVYLDDDQMFRTHFRNKQAPVLEGGWSKPKRSAASTTVPSGAVAAVAHRSVKANPAAVKPAAVKPAAVKPAAVKRSTAPTTVPSGAVTTVKKGGPHGPMYIGIERGHGIAAIFDGTRYSFTKGGIPFSRTAMKKAGFKVCPTPVGIIVYDNSVDKALSTIQKKHLFNESLIWQSKNGDSTSSSTAIKILQENWPLIFSVKIKATGEWTWSKTCYIQSEDHADSSSASEVDEPALGETEAKVEAVSSATFDYSKAVKSKPVIKLKPVNQSKPVIQPKPVSKPSAVELFPALPEMPVEQRKAQIKAKEAHVTKMAEEKRRILEAKAEEMKRKSHAAELQAKADADANAAEFQAAADAKAEAAAADPLEQALRQVKTSKGPVQLKGAALAALLGM